MQYHTYVLFSLSKIHFGSYFFTLFSSCRFLFPPVSNSNSFLWCAKWAPVIMTMMMMMMIRVRMLLMVVMMQMVIIMTWSAVSLFPSHSSVFFRSRLFKKLFIFSLASYAPTPQCTSLSSLVKYLLQGKAKQESKWEEIGNKTEDGGAQVEDPCRCWARGASFAAMTQRSS